MNQNILTVIEKHLNKAVEDIDEPMDPEKQFVDYGANSLDIVEIVSGSMRELKIKIPRTELAKIQNIRGLVEIFERYAA